MMYIFIDLLKDKIFYAKKNFDKREAIKKLIYKPNIENLHK